MRRLVLLAGALLVVLLSVGVAGAPRSAGPGQSRWVSLNVSEAACPSGSAVARWAVTYVGAIGRPNFYFDRFDPVFNDRGQITFMREGRAVLWQSGKVTRLDATYPDRGNASYPTAINEQGQVVGMSYCGECQFPPETPWVWRNGAMTGLGAGGNTPNAIAYPSLNNRGQVVGMGGNHLHAFLWQNGRRSDLGTLPGRRYSDAVAINDRGQVVGRSYAMLDNAYGYLIGPRAFVWQNGKMTDLGALPGDVYSSVQAINARGQIIGRSYPKSAKSYYGDSFEFAWEEGRAVLWQSGKISLIPGRRASVSAINDRGQIVGSSVTKDGRTHAFLWQDGKMRDLGSLPGRPNSDAVAINNDGQIVGTSYLTSKDGRLVGSRAFLWQNGEMTELPATPGGGDYAALDINQRGQILGTIPNKRGEPQAVLLWTPQRGA